MCIGTNPDKREAIVRQYEIPGNTVTGEGVPEWYRKLTSEQLRQRHNDFLRAVEELHAH
jgi:hypothetical protein